MSNIEAINNEPKVQHVFIIGSKSIGQYGGYETFVDKLTEQHQYEPSIKYHIACKANGQGYMDETKLDGIEVTKRNKDGSVSEFTYHNAHVFKIPCPDIGPAVAIYYDRAATIYSINYCKENNIENPIFYIFTCRIGLFIDSLVKDIKSIGGKYYLNPDGHEWMRSKWPKPVRRYWKWSEKKMVNKADLIICDSINIEKYIQEEYSKTNTTYISYGADIEPSSLSDDDPKFIEWLSKNNLKPFEYYMCCGRFVPENNYEIIIREFMKSNTNRDFILITDINKKQSDKLNQKLEWKTDKRIKFVGTVYDKELLKKIRENAYANLHGHEVGGTNPSLLEALGSTQLNLLLDVGFNREVAENGALYWNKNESNLSNLINQVDYINSDQRLEYRSISKNRIEKKYNWSFIGKKYTNIWSSEENNL